jgi:hypothetical protein
MEGPLFQDFVKEVINPFGGQQTQGNNIDNTTFYFNKEENNVSNLIVQRTKQNFGHPVFQIICDKDFNYSNIIHFIKDISGIYKSQEKIIDVTEKFYIDDIDKKTIYIINLFNLKNNIQLNPNAFSMLLFQIIEHSAGLILISNDLDSTPKMISTRSQLVFIQNYKNKNINEYLFKAGNINSKPNCQIENMDLVCLDKLSLWTKVTNFTKY